MSSNFYGCNGNYQFKQYTEQGNFRGNSKYFNKCKEEYIYDKKSNRYIKSSEYIQIKKAICHIYDSIEKCNK